VDFEDVAFSAETVICNFKSCFFIYKEAAFFIPQPALAAFGD